MNKWCLRAESNHRHGDFQSPALPTELQRRFYSTCLVYYILSEMSTTFFKNFCIFCKQEKTVTAAQPATVSRSSSVLRRICPHNKSAALSFSCGSSHTVQPKIVQAKRASFMYAWSSILSAYSRTLSNRQSATPPDSLYSTSESQAVRKSSFSAMYRFLQGFSSV